MRGAASERRPPRNERSERNRFWLAVRHLRGLERHLEALGLRGEAAAARNIAKSLLEARR
jgi:hypothetical protein